MADETNGKKTSTIGVLPITNSKLAKSKELKDYLENARQFSLMKVKVSESKEILKLLLRKHSAALADVENLDFSVIGSNLVIVERLESKTPRRSRSKELDFS